MTSVYCDDVSETSAWSMAGNGDEACFSSAETQRLRLHITPALSGASGRTLFTCITISDEYLLCGTSRGTIHVYLRQTTSTGANRPLSRLPTISGPEDASLQLVSIVPVNEDHRPVTRLALCKQRNLVAIVCAGQHLLVESLQKLVAGQKVSPTSLVLHDDRITHLCWCSKQDWLFFCDSKGLVLVADIEVDKIHEQGKPSFKNMFGFRKKHIIQSVTTLDSPIVQIQEISVDSDPNFCRLLCSCKTQALVVTTQMVHLNGKSTLKFIEATPLGSKPRDGDYGACPWVHETKKYCLSARPGRRLWLADIASGKVASTLKVQKPLAWSKFTENAVAAQEDTRKHPKLQIGSLNRVILRRQRRSHSIVLSMGPNLVCLIDPSADSMVAFGGCVHCTYTDARILDCAFDSHCEVHKSRHEILGYILVDDVGQRNVFSVKLHLSKLHKQGDQRDDAQQNSKSPDKVNVAKPHTQQRKEPEHNRLEPPQTLHSDQFEHSAIILQAFARTILARRHVSNIRVVRQQYHLKLKSATTIESAIRGFLVRQQMKHIGERNTKNTRMHRSTILIQTFIRGVLARLYVSKLRAERAQRQLEHESAVTMCRIVRGYLGRCKAAHVRELHRQALEEKQRYESAIVLQTFIRGVLARLYVSKLRTERAQRQLEHESAVTMCRIVRGYLGRCKAAHVRELHRQALEEKQRLKSAILIQSFVRRILALRHFKSFKVRHENRSVYLRNQCCKQIQRAWRIYCFRHSALSALDQLLMASRLEMNRQNIACLRIQRVICTWLFTLRLKLLRKQRILARKKFASAKHYVLERPRSTEWYIPSSKQHERAGRKHEYLKRIGAQKVAISVVSPSFVRSPGFFPSDSNTRRYQREGISQRLVYPDTITSSKSDTKSEASSKHFSSPCASLKRLRSRSSNTRKAALLRVPTAQSFDEAASAVNIQSPENAEQSTHRRTTVGSRERAFGGAHDSFKFVKRKFSAVIGQVKTAGRISGTSVSNDGKDLDDILAGPKHLLGCTENDKFSIVGMWSTVLPHISLPVDTPNDALDNHTKEGISNQTIYSIPESRSRCSSATSQMSTKKFNSTQSIRKQKMRISKLHAHRKRLLTRHSHVKLNSVNPAYSTMHTSFKISTEASYLRKCVAETVACAYLEQDTSHLLTGKHNQMDAIFTKLVRYRESKTSTQHRKDLQTLITVLQQQSGASGESILDLDAFLLHTPLLVLMYPKHMAWRFAHEFGGLDCSLFLLRFLFPLLVSSACTICGQRNSTIEHVLFAENETISRVDLAWTDSSVGIMAARTFLREYVCSRTELPSLHSATVPEMLILLDCLSNDAKDSKLSLSHSETVKLMMKLSSSVGAIITNTAPKHCTLCRSTNDQSLHKNKQDMLEDNIGPLRPAPIPPSVRPRRIGKRSPKFNQQMLGRSSSAQRAIKQYRDHLRAACASPSQPAVRLKQNISIGDNILYHISDKYATVSTTSNHINWMIDFKQNVYKALAPTIKKQRSTAQLLSSFQISTILCRLRMTLQRAQSSNYVETITQAQAVATVLFCVTSDIGASTVVFTLMQHPEIFGVVFDTLGTFEAPMQQASGHKIQTRDTSSSAFQKVSKQIRDMNKATQQANTNIEIRKLASWTISTVVSHLVSDGNATLLLPARVSDQLDIVANTLAAAVASIQPSVKCIQAQTYLAFSVCNIIQFKGYLYCDPIIQRLAQILGVNNVRYCFWRYAVAQATTTEAETVVMHSLAHTSRRAIWLTQLPSQAPKLETVQEHYTVSQHVQETENLAGKVQDSLRFYLDCLGGSLSPVDLLLRERVTSSLNQFTALLRSLGHR